MMSVMPMMMMPADADDTDVADANDVDVADLGFVVADVNQIYVLFLSVELLKIKEDLIKGFPHIGVFPWLAATSCVSCLGLFSVDRVMFYLHFTYVHVIANLWIIIRKISKLL